MPRKVLGCRGGATSLLSLSVLSLGKHSPGEASVCPHTGIPFLLSLCRGWREHLGSSVGGRRLRLWLFFIARISQWCSPVIPRPHGHCQTGFHGDRVLSPMRLGLTPWGRSVTQGLCPRLAAAPLISYTGTQLWLYSLSCRISDH